MSTVEQLNAQLTEVIVALNLAIDKLLAEADFIVPEAIEVYLLYIAHLSIRRRQLIDAINNYEAGINPASPE